MGNFSELDTLLKRKNQRFICKDIGWPKPSLERHIAQINHNVTLPLVFNHNAQVPNIPQLVSLYSNFKNFMSNFSIFDIFLKRKNQKIICKELVEPEPSLEWYIAEISHHVTPPLSTEDILKLNIQFPNNPKFVALYSKYGSIRLYCDAVFTEEWGRSAFYIASPAEWEVLQESFNDWIIDAEDDEFLPSWLNNYIVIGEAPNSGNYFLMPIAGERTGQIYEFEHDSFEFIKRSDDIESFIAQISTVDERLIQEIKGHITYYDGKTDMQWLIERYEFD